MSEIINNIPGFNKSEIQDPFCDPQSSETEEQYKVLVVPKTEGLNVLWDAHSDIFSKILKPIPEQPELVGIKVIPEDEFNQNGHWNTPKVKGVYEDTYFLSVDKFEDPCEVEGGEVLYEAYPNVSIMLIGTSRVAKELCTPSHTSFFQVFNCGLLYKEGQVPELFSNGANINEKLSWDTRLNTKIIQKFLKNSCGIVSNLVCMQHPKGRDNNSEVVFKVLI